MFIMNNQGYMNIFLSEKYLVLNSRILFQYLNELQICVHKY